MQAYNYGKLHCDGDKMVIRLSYLWGFSTRHQYIEMALKWPPGNMPHSATRGTLTCSTHSMESTYRSSEASHTASLTESASALENVYFSSWWWTSCPSSGFWSWISSPTRRVCVLGQRNIPVNSLAPGKFAWNFRYVIFKQILVIDGRCISCEIALIWMSLDFNNDQSTLVQVMAWCGQATSHYLSQCWHRSLLPHGVTRPAWVKSLAPERCEKNIKWIEISHANFVIKLWIIFSGIILLGYLRTPVNIGLGFGLVPSGNSADQNLCQHMASLGEYESYFLIIQWPLGNVAVILNV